MPGNTNKALTICFSGRNYENHLTEKAIPQAKGQRK